MWGGSGGLASLGLGGPLASCAPGVAASAATIRPRRVMAGTGGRKGRSDTPAAWRQPTCPASSPRKVQVDVGQGRSRPP